MGRRFSNLSARSSTDSPFRNRRLAILEVLRTNLHRDLFNVVGLDEVVLEDCWKVAVKLLEHAIPVMKVFGNYCRCNHVVALIQDWKKNIQGLNVLLSTNQIAA